VLIGAAVLPAAPVLLPQVSQGAAPELEQCRRAVHAALTDLLGPPVDRVVVVGAGAATRRVGASAQGSLHGIGVDLTVGWGDVEPPADGTASSGLPRSMVLAAWALTEAGWTGATCGVEVAVDEDPQVCLGLGAGLADEPGQVALVLAADGTARRGTAAPGYTDERSQPFDEQWTQALARVDAQALAGLDPHLAAELMMEGRAPLQVLAGAVLASAGAGWQARTWWEGDPYGVAYAVASWRLPASADPGDVVRDR
jgi:hypothetical protein